MADDAILLRRYARRRDTEAFAEMVRRHAGMVYGTCLRVLRNTQDAEDVAQECFLELARHAGRIRSSLSGWLHTLATHRARNAIRDAATRRRHEEQAVAQRHANAEPTWAEVSLAVDEALEELPEELRAPLVLHYLRGCTQAEAAAQLGVNQSTVSRRIERGLAELRGVLKRVGLVASVVALATLLAENAACAAPAGLMTALGKMALAGPPVGKPASAPRIRAVRPGAVKGIAIGIGAAAAVALLAVAIVHRMKGGAPEPVKGATAAGATASPPRPPLEIRRRAVLDTVHEAYRRRLQALRQAPYDQGVSDAPYIEEFFGQPLEWVVTYSLVDRDRALELASRLVADIAAQPVKTSDGRPLVSAYLAPHYASACELARELIAKGEEAAKTLTTKLTPQEPLRWPPPILDLLLKVAGTDDAILQYLERAVNGPVLGGEWMFDCGAYISRTRPLLTLRFLEQTKHRKSTFFHRNSLPLALRNIGDHIRSKGDPELKARFEAVLNGLRQEAEALEKGCLEDRAAGHKYGNITPAYAHVAIGYQSVGNAAEARRTLDLALLCLRRFPEFMQRGFQGGVMTFHLYTAELLIDPESGRRHCDQFLDAMYPSDPSGKPLCTIGSVCDYTYAFRELLGPAWERTLQHGMHPVAIRTKEYWRLYYARPYLSELYARGEVLEGLRFFEAVSRGELDPLAEVQRIRLSLLNATRLGAAVARLDLGPDGETRLAEIEAAVLRLYK